MVMCWLLCLDRAISHANMLKYLTMVGTGPVWLTTAHGTGESLKPLQKLPPLLAVDTQDVFAVPTLQSIVDSIPGQPRQELHCLVKTWPGQVQKSPEIAEHIMSYRHGSGNSICSYLLQVTFENFCEKPSLQQFRFCYSRQQQPPWLAVEHFS